MKNTKKINDVNDAYKTLGLDSGADLDSVTNAHNLLNKHYTHKINVLNRHNYDGSLRNDCSIVNKICLADASANFRISDAYNLLKDHLINGSDSTSATKKSKTLDDVIVADKVAPKYSFDALIFTNKDFYDAKYIIAKVKDKKVLVSMGLDFHSDILRLYKNMADGDVTVLGGGILTMDSKAKAIKTYGKSVSFGKPNVNDVYACLKAKFPDYTLDLKVTDYIRV